MAKYNDLLSELNLVLPGVARPIATPLIPRVVERFCDASRIWRKALPAVEIDPAYTDTGTGQVMVDIAKGAYSALVMAEAQLLDVMEVSVNGQPLPTDAFDRVARKGIVLHRPPIPGQVEVIATLTPANDAQEIPDFLLHNWGETLAYGIAGRLAMQPGQSWTNFDLAQVYDSRFKQGCNDALFESNNQRQGNRTVTHNFYGG